MRGLGSGQNGEWTFLDIVALISFVVGLENLDMNITQEDLQHEEATFNDKLTSAVNDIHNHLSVQDSKINLLLENLKQLEEIIHEKD